jgi:DNA-directed RNA polymerase specialized sigma24 family protein
MSKDAHWLEWYEIARTHTKSKDLIQDIVIRLHDAYIKYNSQNGNLPPPLMHKIAINCVRDNWRRSQRERFSCVDLEQNIHTLNENGVRTTIEAGQLLKNKGFVKQLEAEDFLSRCPTKLIQIADKIQSGETLTATERQYLWRYRKQHDIKIKKGGDDK